MAARYRTELEHAFHKCAQAAHSRSKHIGQVSFPSVDEWKILDVAYANGVQVGYARGFVHGTATLLVMILAAVVWLSLFLSFNHNHVHSRASATVPVVGNAPDAPPVSGARS
jgi:hypothetical protein